MLRAAAGGPGQMGRWGPPATEGITNIFLPFLKKDIQGETGVWVGDFPNVPTHNLLRPFFYIFVPKMMRY